MQEDSDGAPLVFDYVVGISAGTAYQASVEYRLFILARFPQPPLDKRNGSTLLFTNRPMEPWHFVIYYETISVLNLCALLCMSILIRGTN